MILRGKFYSYFFFFFEKCKIHRSNGNLKRRTRLKSHAAFRITVARVHIDCNLASMIKAVYVNWLSCYQTTRQHDTASLLRDPDDKLFSLYSRIQQM